MVFPGGWNDLIVQEPKRIKPIISVAQIHDGSNYYDGEIVQSSVYFLPSGGSWSSNPFVLTDEPKVVAVNNGIFFNEGFRAMAMNQQTKMSNISDAPPPMSNLLFLYGNRNGDLKYRMEIYINFGINEFPWVELSVLENAAGTGGANGVVEAYRFEKSNFSGLHTLHLFFDNYFGLVNLGLRAEDSLSNSSIFEMRCVVLDAETI